MIWSDSPSDEGWFTPDTHKVMVQVQVNGVVTVTKRVGWLGGDPVFRQFSYKLVTYP